jgi:adenine-specific DNA-methyltransferase
VTELDDALARVTDEGLRAQLQAGVDALTRQMRFGLVFERHLPESVRAYGAPIRAGDAVQLRAEASGAEYVVEKSTTRTVTARDADGKVAEYKPRELVVVKRFGEPAYPALSSVDTVVRSDERPFHSVINGENYHALQLLRYLYRGKVDCIYIDPPYNTGASDWKYNNRYVDGQDRWRHSKWLSFMEKRLTVARDLLKPDGVLIVTIDEHEVHHLGVLLEQIFPGYLHQTVSIVINPKGTGKLNFSRIAEYAIFCIPDNGENVIRGLPADEAELLVGKRTKESQEWDDANDAEFDIEWEDTDEPTDRSAADPDDDGAADDEVDEEDEVEILARTDLPFPVEDLPLWELRHARRRGGESSYRPQRWRQFYPLYVDAEAGLVVRAGEAPPLTEEPTFDVVDGLTPVWPIDSEGNQRCWRYIPSTMSDLIDAGRVVLGRPSPDGRGWTINYWTPRVDRKKYKNLWWSTLHDAGTHGTTLLHKFLERRDAFPFPKSLYAVRDTLLTVVRDRPNALILDFFAGSGTTLHATALINAMDGGSRQAILVTNNEVAAKTATALQKKGLLPGDDKYEEQGIFRQATKPRIEAALTGRTPSGKPVAGTYFGGRPHAEGFEENVEFFDLIYLDRDAVRRGSEFAAIEPLLWLAAGGVGERAHSDASADYAISESSNYAILFQRSSYSPFVKELRALPRITRVFLVTDSEDAYRQMVSRLPSGLTSSMLYRDYLSNFRINTVEAYR